MVCCTRGGVAAGDGRADCAAVGLVVKVLGPIGMVVSIQSGAWPAETAWLCVGNDLIWWVPFGWYLWGWKKIRPQSPGAGL